MIEFFAGLVAGAIFVAWLLQPELTDLDAERDRLRAALVYVKNASPDPAIRRFSAKALDPDGDEAGA
jgi:hypothetical protein